MLAVSPSSWIRGQVDHGSLLVGIMAPAKVGAATLAAARNAPEMVMVHCPLVSGVKPSITCGTSRQQGEAGEGEGGGGPGGGGGGPPEGARGAEEPAGVPAQLEGGPVHPSLGLLPPPTCSIHSHSHHYFPPTYHSQGGVEGWGQGRAVDGEVGEEVEGSKL